MIKEIIGWALILIGIFTIGNFFAHHTGGIPVDDADYHALEGLLMTVCGVYLLKSSFTFRDGWNKL